MENEITMIEGIEKLVGKIRPVLQRDGGDVQFIGVEDGVVKVKLVGACHGCPGAQMTLKNVIERVIREEYPDIKGVEGI